MQLHLSQHKANTITTLNLSMHQYITCAYIQLNSLWMYIYIYDYICCMNHKHSCKWLQVSKIRGRSVTDMAFCSANSVLTLDTLLWNTSCAWPDLGVRSVRSPVSRRLVKEFSLPCAEEKLILTRIVVWLGRNYQKTCRSSPFGASWW